MSFEKKNLRRRREQGRRFFRQFFKAHKKRFREKIQNKKPTEKFFSVKKLRFLSAVNPWVKIILTPRNKSIIKNKMVKNAYVLLAVFL
jgi:hypothetical protein